VYSLKLVLKISGHLLSPKAGALDVCYIKELVKALKQLVKERHRLIVVTGGGETAREYIRAGEKLGLTEYHKDRIGISVSRLHALVLAFSLPGSLKHIPHSVEELERYVKANKVIVVGGFEPGQSTTTVAVLCAEAVNADKLIIATNVDGIYTSDPRRDPSARLLEKVHVDELERILTLSQLAGTYPLFDRLSLSILKRSRIRTIVVNGKPPENILKAVQGVKVGSEIVFKSRCNN